MMITYSNFLIHNWELSKKRNLSYSYGVDIDKLIGKNLRRIREQKKISQEQLAELINTPSTRLSAYETGREGMGKDIMSRVCKALDVRPYEFYFELGIPLIVDNDEKDLLHTYREAKELGGAVAEKIPQYGRFLLTETKKPEGKTTAKSRTSRIKATTRGVK